MTATEGEVSETSESFLLHLKLCHSTHLHGGNAAPNPMNDVRIFRSMVCELPQAEVAKVISRIQEVRHTHS